MFGKAVQGGEPSMRFGVGVRGQGRVRGHLKGGNSCHAGLTNDSTQRPEGVR